MIIKNIFKVKIHFFFYVVLCIALITGNIIDFLIFTSIIVIHEFGHIFGACFFGWNIKEIIILPFGGLTVFNQKINTSLFEQFVVTILGPLFQFVFYLIIRCFFIVSPSVIYYNYILLVFNLLPIYPLDGSKFMYIFLCSLLPFKISHLLLMVISMIFIFGIVFIFFDFDFLIFLIFLFLFLRVVKEFKSHRLIFNKFLLERYNCDFNFRRIKIIRGVNKMFLCYKHLFYIDNSYFTEKSVLEKRFDKYYKL